MEKIRERTTTTFRRIVSVRNALLGLVAAGGAMYIGIRTNATLARETLKYSEILGANTREIQIATRAAEDYGVSQEQILDFLSEINNRAADAATTGIASYTDAFKALDIDTRKFLRLPIREQLLEISDAINRLPTRGQRIFLLEEIAGGPGREVIDLLARSRQEIEAIFDRVERAGTNNRQQLQDIVMMDNIIKNIGQTLRTTFAAGLSRNRENIERILVSIRDNIPRVLDTILDQVSRIGDRTDLLTGAIESASNAAILLLENFQLIFGSAVLLRIGTQVSIIFTAMVGAFNLFGITLKKVGGYFTAINAWLGRMIGRFSQLIRFVGARGAIVAGITRLVGLAGAWATGLIAVASTLAIIKGIVDRVSVNRIIDSAREVPRYPSVTRNQYPDLRDYLESRRESFQRYKEELAGYREELRGILGSSFVSEGTKDKIREFLPEISGRIRVLTNQIKTLDERLETLRRNAENAAIAIRENYAELTRARELSPIPFRTPTLREITPQGDGRDTILKRLQDVEAWGARWELLEQRRIEALEEYEERRRRLLQIYSDYEEQLEAIRLQRLEAQFNRLVDSFKQAIDALLDSIFDRTRSFIEAISNIGLNLGKNIIGDLISTAASTYFQNKLLGRNLILDPSVLGTGKYAGLQSIFPSTAPGRRGPGIGSLPGLGTTINFSPNINAGVSRSELQGALNQGFGNFTKILNNNLHLSGTNTRYTQ